MGESATRPTEKHAPLVTDLAQRYLDHHAGPKTKRSSAAGDERLLRLYALPALGKRKVASTSTKDVADLSMDSAAPGLRGEAG